MKAQNTVGEKQWWIIALVLGLFAFALYANTIPNGYALDDELVTRNQPLTSQGIKAIPEIFSSYYYDNKIGNYFEYRPVVLTSFAIEHTIFGESPHVSHAINALLYGLSCMVLLFVIRSFKPEISWLFPALATLFFAAHPLHTEVVASIKNRDEIFSFLFGISALFWSLKYVKKGSIGSYALFLLFILLSVMSKRSVLSYTVIIPLAACWFSSASLVRLLSLSFPLMLIVLFFSPIYEKHINALIIGGIISFPVVIWSIKIVLTEGWQGISGPVTGAFKSIFVSPQDITPANPTKVKGKDTSKSNTAWAAILAIGLLGVGALVAQYLDLRVLMWICLAIILLATFVLRPHDKAYPILLLLLVVGLTAANFQLHFVAYAVIGLFFGTFFFGGLPSPARILAPVFAVIVAAAYLFRAADIGDAFIDIVVMLVVITAHHFIKNKRVMPILLLVMGIMKLIFEPHYQLIWIMNLVGAVYLFIQPRLTKPIAFYTALASIGAVAIFVLTIYPYQPANPIYEANLGVYYDTLPDPYGDGPKSVTNVVPGAGREVDFVENPLVNETKASVKVATAAKVMGYYTYLFAAPIQLRFYYGFNQIPIVGLSDPIAILSLVSYLVLLVFAFYWYKRDALLSFALLYMLFGLLFISNLGVLLTGIVAERLAYGTSLGFCLLLAWGIIKVFRLSLWDKYTLKGLKPAFLIAVVVITSLYTARTVIRNTNWSSKFALYEHDAKISPNSAKVQQLLGNEYLNMGIRDNGANQAKYYDLAEKYLKNAINVAPKFHSALFDLGHLYSLKEDCASSVVYLERFMAVSQPPPLALFHYAVCLDLLGRYKEALNYYEQVVNVDPFFVAGYSNLIYLHFRMGNIPKALEIGKRAIALMPNEVDPYINTGTIYVEQKQPLEALPYFEKAYELNPKELNVVLQLWDIHSQVGDPERGKFFYSKALELGYKPR